MYVCGCHQKEILGTLRLPLPATPAVPVAMTIVVVVMVALQCIPQREELKKFPSRLHFVFHTYLFLPLFVQLHSSRMELLLHIRQPRTVTPERKIFDNGDLLYEKGQVSEALAGGSVVSVVWVVSTQVGGRQQKMKSIPTKIKQVGLSTRIQKCMPLYTAYTYIDTYIRIYNYLIVAILSTMRIDAIRLSIFVDNNYQYKKNNLKCTTFINNGSTYLTVQLNWSDLSEDDHFVAVQHHATLQIATVYC